MKRVFYTHLGYMYMSIILILISLLAFIIPLISLIQNYNDKTSAKIIIVIISFLVTTFFVITFGFTFIQWVEIDERKIVAKTLFNTILEVKWIDVKTYILIVLHLVIKMCLWVSGLCLMMEEVIHLKVMA